MQRAAEFAIKRMKQSGTYRTFRYLDTAIPSSIWCSNDYLGLSRNAQAQQAAVREINRVGVGAGGTRNIAGSTVAIKRLERGLATFLDTESALVFGSGYAANAGSLRSLGSLVPNTLILSDEHNHASMIDGIRSSGAEYRVMAHNSVDELRTAIEHESPDRSIIVAFESVYSMSGNHAPVERIVELATRHPNVLLYCDEIHAFGLYGPTKSSGLLEGLIGFRGIKMGGFGKAGGSLGGYIAGDQSLIDYIRMSARVFIFTTALPPAICAVNEHVLDVFQAPATARDRTRMFSNAEFMFTRLTAAGIPARKIRESHIIVVPFDTNALCQAVSERLYSQGHYAQAIVYPTVTEPIFRITCSPTQSRAQISAFVEAIVRATVSVNSKKAETSNDIDDIDGRCR
jgi:5-aminolevulinate synthase